MFVGDLVGDCFEINLKRKLAPKNLTEEKVIVETDKSNGVLLASGSIAGGAIAGILIAVFAVWTLSLNASIWLNDTLGAGLELANADKGVGIAKIFAGWAKTHNPFFSGEWWTAMGMRDLSDLLGFLPILVLVVVLYLVGRELWLAGRKAG